MAPGKVAAIGEGVTRVKMGDRIVGCFHPRWFGGPIKPDYLTDRLGANLDGMLAEYAVFNEGLVCSPLVTLRLVRHGAFGSKIGSRGHARLSGSICKEARGRLLRQCHRQLPERCHFYSHGWVIVG